jgi:hypothetical protein
MMVKKYLVAMMVKKYLVVAAAVLLVAMGGAVALMSSPPSKPQLVACRPGFINLTETFCVLAPLGAQNSQRD